RVGRGGRRLPGLVQQRDQLEPVPVLVLDSRVVDDHPRRARERVGRGDRGARAHVYRPQAARPPRPARHSGHARPEGRRDRRPEDRDLRLPARDHDGDETPGTLPRTQAEARACRGHRNRRSCVRREGVMATEPAKTETPDAASNGGTLQTARDVSKRFGGLLAVDTVTFDIPRQSIVSIIGPNGAGKTTFFNMLTGLDKPTTGRVTFDGDDITAMRPDRIMKRGLARTCQNIRLFGTMSAVENVLVAQHSRTRPGLIRSIVHTPGQRREEKQAREKAREELAYVGLREGVFDEISVNLAYGDQR